MAGKRRDHGDGSVSQRKDGRWQIAFYVDGKRRYVYGRTKTEAKEKHRKAQRQIESSGKLASAGRLKVADYLEYWLEVRRPPRVRQTTWQGQAGFIRSRIIPALGHIQLQKLSTDRIEAFYGQLLREIKPITIRTIHVILSGALRDAVRWGRITVNPASGIKLPQIFKRNVYILSQEEASKLLLAAHGTLLEQAIPMVLATGIRKGELLALHWEDIDFERKIVKVGKTLTEQRGKGQVESEAKTEESRRFIALADFAVEALKKQKLWLAETRLKLGPAWAEHGLIFPSGHGKPLWHSQAQRVFKRILQKAGLPEDMHFHDLRHNAATILLSMGVDLKIVQEILGHSTIVTTANIYGHVTPKMQEKAMDSMDKFLQGT